MGLSEHEVAVLANILADAARQEILPRFRPGGIGDSRQKTSQLDLVTDADEAAEAFIARALAGAFPAAVVLGEEACGRDPSTLGALATADRVIVVDPVDGTKNFASGLPLFGVMAGVVDHGEVVAGVILDPFTGTWVEARAGCGAWFRSSDGTRARLRVAQARPVREMVGVVSWMFMAEPRKSRLLAGLAATSGAADYRCAAHHYRLVAGARYDFALSSKLMPWDHVAGWLIHREAGGYAARLDGSPYQASATEGGLLCAPDEAAWNALHAALLG